MRLILALMLFFISPIVSSGEVEDSLRVFLSNYSVKKAYPKLESFSLPKGVKGPVYWSWPGFSNFPKKISIIATEKSGKKWYIPITVSWYVDAVVAKEDIVWGQEILPEMVSFKKRAKLESVRARWYASVSGVLNSKANAPIKEGSVILRSKIKKTPDVSRGQQVEFVSNVSGIRVSRTVKAMHNAFIGDYVKVKVKNSRALLSGKVISKGVVLSGVGK